MTPRVGPALLAAALVAPTAATAQPTDWRSAVADLLARRARAVRAGDETAFRATMAGAPRAFVEGRVAWLRRMRALPVNAYDLRVEPDGYDDLLAALGRRPRGDEVHVVEVQERLALRGYDAAPAVGALFLTVLRRGPRWSVVSDSGLEDLGLPSARALWDFAPVRRVERGGAMVLYHRDPASARRVLDATLDAVTAVRRAWPYRWRARVVVAIPRTREELSRIFGSAFDVGPFVAFTSSSLDRSGGGFVLGGHRVYVQPASFFGHTAGFQRETLRHELLHLATRDDAGPFTPAWLDEGVAQLYGEGRTPPTPRLAASVRAGTFGGLPDDATFIAGTPAEIRTAYEASASFVAYLRARFGRGAGARLYRALGAENPVSPGTWRYHLDRAARSVFRIPFRQLERAWMRHLEEELG